MSQLDIDQEPYLPPEYQQSIEPVRSVLHELEFPAQPEVPQLEVLQRVVGKIASWQIDVVHIFKHDGRKTVHEAQTTKDLDAHLKLFGLAAVNSDLMYQVILNILTSQLGVLDVTNDVDEEQKAAMVDFASGVMLHRARTNATSLLGSAHTLYCTYSWEDVSSWQRANNAYDRVPTVKRPVEIGEEEGQIYDTILEQVMEAEPRAKTDQKISRFKAVNAMRLTSMAKKVIREHSKTTPEERIAFNQGIITQLMESSLPAAELSPEDIDKGVRTARKAVRYLLGAIKLDGGLAEDPKVRNVVFLNKQLGGYHLKSEQAVFDRNRRKVAKRERKIHT